MDGRRVEAALPAGLLHDTLAPYVGRFVQVGYAGALGPVSELLELLAPARR